MTVCFFIALVFFARELKALGRNQGDLVKAASETDAWVVVDKGSKSQDFPIISLLTKDQIALLKGETKTESGYLYAPQATHSIRFIAQDEARYFLVEKSDSNVKAFMIRKDEVIAIEFAKRDVFP